MSERGISSAFEYHLIIIINPNVTNINVRNYTYKRIHIYTQRERDWELMSFIEEKNKRIKNNLKVS